LRGNYRQHRKQKEIVSLFSLLLFRLPAFNTGYSTASCVYLNTVHGGFNGAVTLSSALPRE